MRQKPRYSLGRNQSLAQRMARIRKQVRTSGNYVSKQHPDAPNTSMVEGHLCPTSRKRLVNTRFDADSPYRRSFTALEIEAMYLALVKVMAYYGGDRTLAARETGFTAGTLSRWIKTGRMTPMGAYILGENINIPFDKYELRPDLSDVAWKRFAATYDKAYAQRVRLKYQETNRITI